MEDDIKILRLKGRDIIQYIPELAKLRITIFKDYPYLYLGDLEYERNYLNTYVQCPESIIVLALDHHGSVMGASTAIPLEFETMEFQQPFLDHDFNVKDVFYFGESLLYPEYRGRGIYKHFFREREAAAREYGCKLVAFAAIERPIDDPKKPKDYLSLENIWKYFRYEKHMELKAYFEWKEIGETDQSLKPLIFWLKSL